MIQQYRLVKDMPDLKAGELFDLVSDQTNGTFYQSQTIDDWGVPRMYRIETIEAHPDWFIDATLPAEVQRTPVINGVETEIVRVKGTQYDFDVIIPKVFAYSTCKFCNMPNLVWGQTKKGKKIPIRFNEQGDWVAHFSECQH